MNLVSNFHSGINDLSYDMITQIVCESSGYHQGSVKKQKGGSIMMQIYVMFEGFALISALFGLIL